MLTEKLFLFFPLALKLTNHKILEIVTVLPTPIAIHLEKKSIY